MVKPDPDVEFLFNSLERRYKQRKSRQHLISDENHLSLDPEFLFTRNRRSNGLDSHLWQSNNESCPLERSHTRRTHPPGRLLLVSQLTAPDVAEAAIGHRIRVHLHYHTSEDPDAFRTPLWDMDPNYVTKKYIGGTKDTLLASSDTPRAWAPIHRFLQVAFGK